jgi:adenosyl cobinamide kinase/adenosyl cobinamide phosphate guanylyltransferase
MMERRSINYALFIGTLSILGVMVFSPHLVYAQEVIDEPNVLPDSIFWGVKLAIETIQENFTFQDDRKAELILKHSEERDREAQALERQGKMIPLERLKEIQADKLKRAEEIIIRLERAQNIIDQQQQAFEERRELAQAQTEEERIAIQMQQRARDLAEQSVLIEPKIGMGIIEPNTIRLADNPVTILPVDDITDEDDPSDIITKLRIRLENSFSSSELTEIRAKFSELREEEDPDRQVLLADSLDDRVNNPLVSITCFGSVSTLSLARADDPVTDLQEQCPVLRTIQTEELRQLANGIG